MQDSSNPGEGDMPAGLSRKPITGGFASLQPADADYAVQVCREQDPVVTCRVQWRLEPEHPADPAALTSWPASVS